MPCWQHRIDQQEQLLTWQKAMALNSTKGFVLELWEIILVMQARKVIGDWVLFALDVGCTNSDTGEHEKVSKYPC
jgi:hypothetical protein